MCTKTRRNVTDHPHRFLVGRHAGTKRVDKIIKVTAVRVDVNVQQIARNCGVRTCQIIFGDVLHLVVNDVQQENTARHARDKQIRCTRPDKKDSSKVLAFTITPSSQINAANTTTPA